ncbi:hypothetical protein EFK68_03780 [Pseudomonas aeruginosa]|uniref:hypothetical protein n=1 Tax=Pseudomonas aeruginosa TaxID=287 RepID=UPI000F6AABB1|nr:hypothetical protein [Pseudomonas aeruginosa]EKF7416899.1 hypothetical protein [Pseudomonas aeruginosa]MDS9918398.1 hypothetical protein [Pseudomonas aeruginosa]RNF58505.1 hypothetical protein EFK68_03780 [Pseudomonas aeruginosa]HCA5866529.1 hypothetical protein [Pseudomonas aeruginosa]HCA7376646.1 hypothetical protein [Pseudomonas aeruginosa]
MTEKSTFPVAISNVIFLDGQPGQDQLGRIANTAISEEALQAAIGTFSDTLLRVGRPGQRSNIVIEYGPRVIDWVMAGAYLKRAPWHNAYWAKDLKMPIFELHSRSAGGWCAEACDGVLLHVRFYGAGDGLNSHQMACLLSESAEPRQELVDWLQGILDADYDFIFDDAVNHIPEHLRQHLGYNFLSLERVVNMWAGGNQVEGGLFLVSEHERYPARDVL